MTSSTDAATRLGRDAPLADLLVAPAEPSATGIVHLGLGNFHRAHQAVYTAIAQRAEPGDWGVLGVANRSRHVVDAMRAQDHLYSVLQIAPGRSTVSVPGVHTGTLVAADDPEAVVAAAAAATTRIVSMTVTEHGYHVVPGTGRLDLDAADVRHDLGVGAAPVTTVGQLARALERRALGHGEPVTVLSCDNLQSNGSTTRALVLDFLAASGADQDVLDWVADRARFPNSMVDRIVPATTDRYADEVRRVTGLADAAPVPAEPFTMWVLEDDFAAGRPAWERGGAVFSPEVEAYELVKLRLLNGTHSLLAYLGALDGRATIPDARAQEFVERAARAVIADEYLPSITLPRGFDVDAYVAQLFDRWSNSALGHRTSQVGSDGSVKLPQRVPVPAVRALREGRVPEHLALTVAAWLCCVAPIDGFEPGPHAAAMTDPARARLAELARTTRSTDALVDAVLGRGGLLGDEIAAHPAFAQRVAAHVRTIVAHGVRAAAAGAARAAGAA
ncbi:mannitol dehydrogenase family protein [Cellulosimicrobium cellulans]|uniref:mannitol dehydrogenase family protein n=1 Tax=Cellulosimicrobium cellulans TaxID=1710 RepID=UPI001965B4FA|nr:mannitol dehydrogenase family protein [Cellulosimicrobium cellulans]MBN0038582.1 mannitol dehydrogenase family protein [Cellulosimicrobium cellulans]